MTGRRERLFVRAVLVAVLVAVPVQHVVTGRVGKLYPSLTYPSFGSTPPIGDEVTVERPRFDVIYLDGTTASFDHLELLDDFTVIPLPIVRIAFRRDLERGHDARTVAWLADLITDASGGREPASIEVRWVRERYRLSSGERIGDGTVVAAVDLEPAR